MKKILLALAAVAILVGSASACNYGNVQTLVAQQNIGYAQTYGYVAPLQLNTGCGYGAQNLQFQNVQNVGYGYRQNIQFQNVGYGFQRQNIQFLNTGYGHNNIQNVRVIQRQVVTPRRGFSLNVFGY